MNCCQKFEQGNSYYYIIIFSLRLLQQPIVVSAQNLQSVDDTVFVKGFSIAWIPDLYHTMLSYSVDELFVDLSVRRRDVCKFQLRSKHLLFQPNLWMISTSPTFPHHLLHHSPHRLHHVRQSCRHQRAHSTGTRSTLGTILHPIDCY